VKRVRIGTSSSGVVGAFGSIWATDPPDNLVVRIDPRTLKILKRIPVTAALWTAASDTAVWISRGDGKVSAIDPATNAVTATIPVGRNPGDPAVVGADVWVPSVAEGKVSIVDPATSAVRETLKVGAGPFVVTEIDGEAWIPSYKGRDVWRVRP
jgi:YVTN family beta-propeller protein